jgi:dynein heavy chain
MAFQGTEDEIDLKSIEHQAEENPILARLNKIKAKGILNYVSLKENEPEPPTLVFRHTTKAQERTRKRQQPVKLEPLVS